MHVVCFMVVFNSIDTVEGGSLNTPMLDTGNDGNGGTATANENNDNSRSSENSNENTGENNRETGGN